MVITFLRGFLLRNLPFAICCWQEYIHHIPCNVYQLVTLTDQVHETRVSLFISAMVKWVYDKLNKAFLHFFANVELSKGAAKF